MTREKKNVFLLAGTSVMIVLIATVTYFIAYYQGEKRLEEIRIIYEHRIQTITRNAEEFLDNLSVALTYIDVARYDLKEAKFNLEKSIFLMERERYEDMLNSSKSSIFYFNRSNFVFSKSLSHFESIINKSSRNYTDILTLYINYTRCAINLTQLGTLLSLHLKNASLYYISGDKNRGDEEMKKYNSLAEIYNSYDREMKRIMFEIKDYYNIRE